MQPLQVSYVTAVHHTNEILGLCQNILFINGPFLKEGVYQDLLCHELSLLGITISREYVFPYQMNDSRGQRVTIGNGQSLRSDIELPKLGGILELKSTSHSIKDEYIWQLRNYLEQRPECMWGIVINFISKFGVTTGPTVQAHLLYKEGGYVTVDGVNGTKRIKITKYKSYKAESMSYPLRKEIMLGDGKEVVAEVVEDVVAEVVEDVVAEVAEDVAAS
jgi:hypothetical protein